MADVFQPYAQALVRFTPKIYRKRLKPLQLGHLAALETVSNPLAVGGHVSVSDVLQAVWLCSLDGHKALAAIDDARTTRRLLWFSSLNSRRDHSEAEAEFIAYWGYYADAAPQRWQNGKSDELRAPTAWVVFWRLGGKSLATGRKARELWDTSVNAAFCWIATANATEGDDSLISPKEAIALERLG